MLLLLRVTPRKLRVFSGMFFFPTENGMDQETIRMDLSMLTDPNHEKNIRLSSEPVHLGEAVRDDIRPN